MSNYHYEKGAIHHDYHKEFTMNFKSADDAKSVLRELLKDDAEETDYEEVAEERSTVEETAGERPRRGRKQGVLFEDNDELKYWAERFMGFLNLHNKTGHNSVNTVQDNYINKTMVGFLLYWKRAQVIELSIKGGDCKGRQSYRFMTETCGIKSDTNIDIYNKFFIDRMNDKAYCDKCELLPIDDFIK